MSPDTAEAVVRLNRQLPLFARQQSLPQELQSLHRALLHSFIQQGRPLSSSQIEEMFPALQAEQAIRDLAKQDLIVLDTEQIAVVGCYPMTIEKTPHKVYVAEHCFHAMCALDALAIGPMFNVSLKIESCCALTQTRLQINLHEHALQQVEPPGEIQLGIRWQPPCGVAAHSMCREMVFLKDIETARQWQKLGDTESSLFNLTQAIEFARGFFQPLL